MKAIHKMIARRGNVRIESTTIRKSSQILRKSIRNAKRNKKEENSPAMSNLAANCLFLRRKKARNLMLPSKLRQKKASCDRRNSQLDKNLRNKKL